MFEPQQPQFTFSLLLKLSGCFLTAIAACALCTHVLIREKVTKVEKMNFAMSDLGLLIAG